MSVPVSEQEQDAVLNLLELLDPDGEGVPVSVLRPAFGKVTVTYASNALDTLFEEGVVNRRFVQGQYGKGGYHLFSLKGA